MAGMTQPPDLLGLAEEARLDEAGKAGFWSKLKRGLLLTHTEIIDRVGAAIEGRKVLDEKTLEVLEETLIGADLGVDTSLALIDRVRKGFGKEFPADLAGVKRVLSEQMADLLAAAPQPRKPAPGPTLTLVVGVNGVGKTTSIAKLARHRQLAAEKVMLAAADTFRAAAIEQLVLWGERLGVEVIRQSAGADPGAVVYDAIHAARARKVDHLIVDTAGRLHTKDHLMAELGKVRRVIDREAADWARRTLLVLDATTGQNALAQARTFSQVVPIDGVLLAKLDGTAKGGMAVAVARELRLPVLYLGVGEKADDLVEFRPREFAAALLG
jgi:fused signal recognition particle receptor